MSFTMNIKLSCPYCGDEILVMLWELEKFWHCRNCNANGPLEGGIPVFPVEDEYNIAMFILDLPDEERYYLIKTEIPCPKCGETPTFWHRPTERYACIKNDHDG